MGDKTLEILKRLDGSIVVGMRKTYYIGNVSGIDENGGFCNDDDYNPMHKETCAAYEIMLIDPRYGNKCIVGIKNSSGWCGSGYCEATWYNLSVVEYIDNFGPMTHKAKFQRLKFEVHEKDPDEFYMCDADGFSTNLFVVHDNDDGYYPQGYVDVNEDLFEQLPRAMDRRPVYIFAGESGLGKSTIAMMLSRCGEDFTVYETDKNSKLPDMIYADAVVLGNKYCFDLKEIKERLFDNPKVILVDFKAQN